jgi:hypothetical protein
MLSNCLIAGLDPHLVRVVMESENRARPIPNLKVPAGTNALLRNRPLFREVCDGLAVHQDDRADRNADRMKGDPAIVLGENSDQLVSHYPNTGIAAA